MSHSPDTFETVGVSPRRRDSSSGSGRSLGHHDHRIVVACLMALGYPAGKVFEIDHHFWHQDCLGAAGHAGHGCDPTGGAPHHLDDHHPVVRLGGGRETIDCVDDDLHCGVEAQGHVGKSDVVVDRLGNPDDVETFVLQTCCRSQRAVTADHNDGVNALSLHGPRHRGIAIAMNEGVHPRSPEDGPTEAEDSPHIIPS